MKQAMVIICVLIICILSANAQDKPKAETVRLEPQSQQEISEAQRSANETKAALDAAGARYEAAQQRLMALLFKSMADAGLKPKEWAIKQDQNGIYFERLKPAESAAATQPGKPATTLRVPNDPN